MKFLVLQHVLNEGVGCIGDFAKEEGIQLDVVELWKSYAISTLKSYDALMIMGGPMGVYDTLRAYPSKKDELRLINTNLGKKPMIGFCLGSQLIAHALGAKVYPHPKEIGYTKVYLTPQGQRSRCI